MIVSPIIAPQIAITTGPASGGNDRHGPRRGYGRSKAIARTLTTAPIEPGASPRQRAHGPPRIHGNTSPRPAASPLHERRSAEMKPARITAP